MHPRPAPHANPAGSNEPPDAATGQAPMTGADPVQDLADLRHWWGGAYRITRDNGRFCATHITSGQRLDAGNATELRKLIREHHSRRAADPGRPPGGTAPLIPLAAGGPPTGPGGQALNSPGPAAPLPEHVTRLDALAAELAARGWTGRVYAQPGQRPRLHTRNPEPGAAALSEHIYAHPRADGTWAYWWPWAEPIADSASDAAAVIVRVLRAAGTP